MDAGDPIPTPKDRRRGRGAVSNPSGRFEVSTRDAVHDGWDLDEDLPPLRTEVAEERPRSIITKNSSPDLSFDRSVNPYRGCEHGCIYCFARQSHAFLGLSPGLDFETKLTAKPGAPEKLAEELAAKRYRPRLIAIGTNTDPYQPIERDRKIMRGVLEVLQAHRHPVGIVTKGTLIERDVDILGEMGQAGLVRVGITLTTLDPGLSRRMEPRVPLPARRLTTIRRLTEAGCPVRVMLSPVIPGLTDHEVEAILEAAAQAGVVGASWAMLRLPHEVSPLFREWLAESEPLKAAKVMARVRAVHGGRDYDAQWGKRLRGEGVFANLIARRFKLATQRLGLNRALPDLSTDQFRVPPRVGDQLSLF